MDNTKENVNDYAIFSWDEIEVIYDKSGGGGRGGGRGGVASLYNFLFDLNVNNG